MVTKRISIDGVAYALLKSHMKPGESFSAVVKRLMAARTDFQKWLRKIEADPLSDEAVEAVERVVRERRNPRNRKA